MSVSFLTIFLVFEAFLGLIGLALIDSFLVPNHISAIWNETLTVQFLTLFVPLAAIAFFLTSPWGQRQPLIQSIYKLLANSILGKVIRFGSTSDLMLISLASGWGEELLFRGFLQSKFGLVVAAFAFGLCHSATLGFFILATLMGFYWGWAFQFSHENILFVALLHAGYDAIVLLRYRKIMNATMSPQQEPGMSSK